MWDLLAQILSFLGSRAKWLIALALAIVVWEVLKVATRKTTQKVARYLARNKPKAAGALILILIVALGVCLVVI